MTCRGQLNFAVIGVGSMGVFHCETIQKNIGKSRLVAVCDGNGPLAKSAGERFYVPVFSSPGQLINAGIADAVVVATPHTSHADIAVECMNARLHVLCEKPIAETASKADMMLETAKKNCVVFGVMFQRRLEPGLREAIEYCRQGKLGKIRRATLIAPEYRTQDYYNSSTWRATWKGEGGGVMLNQAPHLVDAFLQMTGLPNKIIGRTSTILHNIEVEDQAEAMLSFPDGGSGYIYASTSEPLPGQMIEIFGDSGKLLWRDEKLQISQYSHSISEFTKSSNDKWGTPEIEKITLSIEQSDEDNFIRAHKNFAASVLDGERLLIDGYSARDSLELTNALYLSSWLKKEIDIPFQRNIYDRELQKKQQNSYPRTTTVKHNFATDPRFSAQK